MPSPLLPVAVLQSSVPLPRGAGSRCRRNLTWTSMTLQWKHPLHHFPWTWTPMMHHSGHWTLCNRLLQFTTPSFPIPASLKLQAFLVMSSSYSSKVGYNIRILSSSLPFQTPSPSELLLASPKCSSNCTIENMIGNLNVGCIPSFYSQSLPLRITSQCNSQTVSPSC